MSTGLNISNWIIIVLKKIPFLNRNTTHATEKGDSFLRGTLYQTFFDVLYPP